MTLYEIKMYQEFDLPVDALWEAFNDHGNFGKMMGQKFVRVKDSTDPANINGVNSVRKIGIPVLPFEETIRKSEKPRLIEYQISKDSPLAHHYGRMNFTTLPGNRSAIDYRIEVGSKNKAFGWLVKQIIASQIGGGLKRYSRQLAKK